VVDGSISFFLFAVGVGVWHVDWVERDANIKVPCLCFDVSMLLFGLWGSISNEIIEWHSLVWVVYVGTTKWATLVFSSSLFFLFMWYLWSGMDEWMVGWMEYLG